MKRIAGALGALLVAAPFVVADPPRTVSFKEAVAIAIAHNSDVRIADDQIRRSHGLLTQAAAALRPVVTAAATYTRIEGERTVVGRETQAANALFMSAGASMPLVDLRGRANRSRAEDQLEVARSDATSVRRDVAIETGRAYLAVLTAQELIAVATQARDTAKAHVDYAILSHKGGVGTNLDTVRAQSELAADESRLAATETAQIRAQEALGVLTGQSGALSVAESPDFSAPVTERTQMRADVLARKLAVSTAEHSLDLQWTEYTPVLALSGDAFYDAPTIAPLPAVGYQVLLSLSVTLYDGGFRAGLREQRAADVLTARETLDEIEREASSEIRVAAAAVENAQHAAADAHHSADLAARALVLATVAYKGGAATNLEVIDAERSARDAATDAVISDNDLRQAQLDLRAATGAFP